MRCSSKMGFLAPMGLAMMFLKSFSAIYFLDISNLFIWVNQFLQMQLCALSLLNLIDLQSQFKAIYLKKQKIKIIKVSFIPQRSLIMFYISVVNENCISSIRSFYLRQSSMRSSEYYSWNLQMIFRLSERASKRRLIYSLRLSVSTMFLMRRMANLTFQVFFFSYYIIFLFCYESSDWVLRFCWNIMRVVKFIVYFEYFSRILRSQRRLRVTWDLFYPLDIDKQRLRVRIRSEEMMMPEMAALKLMILPRQVLGLQSPQPTVPMVMITNQILFSKIQKSCWYSLSLSDIICPNDNTSDMYSNIKKVNGLYQKRALMPKKMLFLVLQMRQSLLARVLQQIELEMIDRNTRQMRSCMRIQKIVLYCSWMVQPQMGYETVSVWWWESRFGCMSNTMNQMAVYFRILVSLFCIFYLSSCLRFRSSFRQYLIPSITTIPRVITECTIRIYSSILVSSLAKMDKNIDTTAKHIIVYCTNTIFLSINIVRIESQN